jgi:DNA-binding response OmpR family regulator
LLEEEQYIVETYGTVHSFREGLTLRKPDLMLMDVMLPDGDGIQVCNEVKSDTTNQHIPVIMMSAHRDFSLITNLCPAEAFINKPFNIDHLVKTVNKQAERTSL